MKIALAALAVIIVLVAGISGGVVGAVLGQSTTQPSADALADIPGPYLALYQAAASACPGLDWTVLAAIGKIETNHGRAPLSGVESGENFAGAGGPMQFLQPTFDSVASRHQLQPGDTTTPSRYNPHDAILAAAYYLCDSGAPKDIRKAIFSYNHADWYVDEVLNQAHRYSETTAGTGNCNQIQAPTPSAADAINYACGQLGLPYQWGGNGPDHGDDGFDCSGLTAAAYAAAGISLPRTAQAQYSAGPLVLGNQPLLPGDLVFYGTPGNVHHVGLYLGAGKMIHAPDFGQPVRVSSYRWNGDDFLKASRPDV